jgi:hypothetical protein
MNEGVARRLGEVMRVARRVGIYLAAPGSLVIVFLVGVALVGVPLLPNGVTWPTGPAVRPIGEPVRIEIPSLRAKAEVDPIVLTGDVLRPPASPLRIGWWTGSAEPGSPTGQTLMTGHSAHAGYSPLNRLREIRRGATISVWSDDRKATYLVKDVVIWSKKKIAQKADILFDPDYHDRRLLLVTSAGYDGTKWNANVLVFAYPV